ncbi:hypothetical protein ACFYXL_14540 [Streptomyces tsukubensis]|uniref:hypothetical protein n=1 Tax=Streptomyces tsukubensis TaxID=83656 RepID=UPI0036D0FBE6
MATAFTRAYVEHDARDGRDRSFATAGGRAAEFAAGELAKVLPQERPGQAGPWAALRAEQAVTRATITSVVVPDGAPAPTPASALVRVAYTLTTTPAVGTGEKERDHLALRLEPTPAGWRVTALPWS